MSGLTVHFATRSIFAAIYFCLVIERNKGARVYDCMTTQSIISGAEYARLKKRWERFEAWRNGRTSYQSSEVPKGLNVTNEERSQIEQYEFVNDPPQKYFVYIRRVNCDGEREEKSLRVQATTWAGDVLGVGMLGYSFRDNFGGERYPVRFRAINGKTYSGTYYSSAGDYARVRVVKGDK